MHGNSFATSLLIDRCESHLFHQLRGRRFLTVKQRSENFELRNPEYCFNFRDFASTLIEEENIIHYLK